MRQFKNITQQAIALLLLNTGFVLGQDRITLGAYYFDGWTGKTPHLTEKLKNQFPEREPIWGWITSTADIMEKQIDVASGVGIDYFSFCWYYNPNTAGKAVAQDPKNNALNLFMKSPNKSRMQFNILVTNNGTYAVKSAEWEALCTYFISLFNDPQYLKVKGKPMISFFDTPSLVKSFGTAAGAKEALNNLRKKAVDAGFPGLLIAGVAGDRKESYDLINSCGYDYVTGYNYAAYALNESSQEVSPIDNMRTKEIAIWSNLANNTGKPVIPTITANWDKRPWDDDNVVSKRFSGFSNSSVARAVNSCRDWMEANKSMVVPGNVALIYAWNEYGEGAYLTPCKVTDNMSEGVKTSLRSQIPTITNP